MKNTNEFLEVDNRCKQCNGYLYTFGGFCEKKHRQVNPNKPACRDNLKKGKMIMEVVIYKAKWDGKRLVPVYVGYIEMDKFDKGECWSICNYLDRDVTKPSNLHSKIGSCSTDVIFYDEEAKKFHIPTSLGWNEADTLDEAVKFWESKDNFSTLPIAKAMYEYFVENQLTFEDMFCPDEAKYNGKDIFWCPWNTVKFLEDYHIDNNFTIGISEYIKTKTGRNTIIDYRIYMYKGNDKFKVDIFTSDTDKDTYEFNDFYELRDFVDKLFYKHPEYKERPTRLFVELPISN